MVAGNDLLTLGCLEALAEAGRLVPDEISVTGYNDMPFVNRLAIPLTTVTVSPYEMGREAARLLLRCLAVPRKSTAPPPESRGELGRARSAAGHIR